MANVRGTTHSTTTEDGSTFVVFTPETNEQRDDRFSAARERASQSLSSEHIQALAPFAVAHQFSEYHFQARRDGLLLADWWVNARGETRKFRIVGDVVRAGAFSDLVFALSRGGDEDFLDRVANLIDFIPYDTEFQETFTAKAIEEWRAKARAKAARVLRFLSDEGFGPFPCELPEEDQ